MNCISLEQITFRYEPEEPAVFKDYDFQVEEGECLILRGDNGAGKTTLFKILNGLVFPEKGSYQFFGTEITRSYMAKNQNSKSFHRRVGYLFQNADVMLFNAKVYDEIAFGPRQMGLSEEEVQIRVEDCMELLDIANLRDKAPYHLSGGQKKKVAIAAILALNPEVFIMDEPLNGLDQKTHERMVDLIRDLKAAGKTLVIATHDDEFAQDIGDRQVNLSFT